MQKDLKDIWSVIPKSPNIWSKNPVSITLLLLEWAVRQCNVAVGLSGGIDSTTVVWILRERGYIISGFYIKSWNEQPYNNWMTALSLSNFINIPLFKVDMASLYKDYVLGSFKKEYHESNVPNPDIICNLYVKLGALVEHSRAIGYCFFATGHYSRASKANESIILLKALNVFKDQSYFLYLITNEVLATLIFPLGCLQKEVLRATATDLSFSNAKLADSKGMCLVNPGDFTAFLLGVIKVKYGALQNNELQTIGEHIGTSFGTVGQKKITRSGKGFFLRRKLIIESKSSTTNTIGISFTNQHKISLVRLIQLKLMHSFIGSSNLILQMKVRSQQYKCSFGLLFASNLQFLQCKCQMASCAFVAGLDISDISPGQHVVFYSNSLCAGGGTIIATSDVRNSRKVN